MPATFTISYHKNTEMSVETRASCRDTMAYYLNTWIHPTRIADTDVLYFRIRIVRQPRYIVDLEHLAHILRDICDQYVDVSFSVGPTYIEPFTAASWYEFTLTAVNQHANKLSIIPCLWWTILAARLFLRGSHGASLAEILRNSRTTDSEHWYRSYDRDQHLAALIHKDMGKEASGVYMLVHSRGPVGSLAYVPSITFARRPVTQSVRDRLVAQAVYS